MKVAITVSYTKTKVVEVDTFNVGMLAEEADLMAADASIPLEWDRTVFENPDLACGGDPLLGEIK